MTQIPIIGRVVDGGKVELWGDIPKPEALAVSSQERADSSQEHDAHCMCLLCLGGEKVGGE